MGEHFAWIGRRNPALEAQVVFEDAETVDYRFRTIGSESIGVYKHRFPKDAFVESYQLKVSET